MPGFKKISYHSDWHSYWELDEHPIKDKDELDIRWPDGTTSRTIARIETSEHRGRGGMDESYSWDVLFFEIRHRGYKSLLRYDKELGLSARFGHA